MSTIREVIQHLENVAPASFQESYDNAGLIVGNPNMEVTGVLICLDSIEVVIQEAISTGSNLIIAHHPIIFKGLKKINGKNYVERVIIQAIKHDIAIFAIHTNLDNCLRSGVNTKIAERLGLNDCEPLAPKQAFRQITATTTPTAAAELKALIASSSGHQKWMDSLPSNATIGFEQNNGTSTATSTIQAVFPITVQSHLERSLVDFFNQNHGHYITQEITNSSLYIGSGIIGELQKPQEPLAFLKFVKRQMKAAVIRHTALLEKPIKKVAVCGGAGSFLLSKAIGKNADIFITADYKYHEFFDADGKIIIADIGHYESEQFTIELLSEIISSKFSTFAVRCTEVDTNPVQYLYGK